MFGCCLVCACFAVCVRVDFACWCLVFVFSVCVLVYLRVGCLLGGFCLVLGLRLGLFVICGLGVCLLWCGGCGVGLKFGVVICEESLVMLGLVLFVDLIYDAYCGI